MQKRLYTGFSFFNLLVSIAIRLCLVIAIILVYPHYNENPAVIAVVLSIFVILIVIIGNDEIVVYEDKVIETDFSFLALLKKRKKTILLSDVKRAYIEQKPKPTLSEAAVAIAVLAMFRTKQSNWENLNTIFFELNDGNTIKWLTDLDSTVVDNIVEAVNFALQKNIKK